VAYFFGPPCKLHAEGQLPKLYHIFVWAELRELMNELLN